MEPSSSAVRVKGRDDACCSVGFLKTVLYVFNFFFWLSGCGIIAIAIYTYVVKSSFISLLASATYASTIFLLIVTGVVILVVGCLGCCSACKELRCGLMLYATLLLLVFLLEAAAGTLAYIYQDHVTEEINRNLNRTMMEMYMVDEAKTVAIDQLQQQIYLFFQFHCCGAGSFSDWQYSHWLRGHPDLNNTAPDSCCKTPSLYCAVRNHPSNIYDQGCTHGLCNLVREQLIILGAVGFGFCALQLFGIVFACYLSKRIQKFREQQEQLAW